MKPTENSTTMELGNHINQDYRKLFDNATISMWNEDFTLVFQHIAELKKLDIPDIKKYLNQNPDVLSSLIKQFKINSVNTSTLKLFKAASEQDFLNNLQIIYGTGANKMFVNLIKSIWNNKKSFTAEVIFKTLKGEEFTALFSTHIPQTELEQKTVPVSIQNLRDAESAEKESLLKLEQAQKIGHIGSWEWNPLTDNAIWSNEMYSIYGVEKAEFDPTSENVGKTILEEDRHKMEHAIGQVFQGEVVDPFEFRILRPNNQIRFLKIIGLQINEGVLFGVTQDITDKKKIENKLNEAQKLAKVGSWLFNPTNQKSEWSDEMFRIWGFDSAKGAPEVEAFTSRVHTEDLELFNQTLTNAATLGTAFDIEYRINLPSDEQKIVKVICKPILDKSGKVFSLTGTSQDITSQKQFEEAHVKHQRLKAIGEISSSVAHDFNNSLQEMMGNLEIMKLQNNFQDSTLERLNNIASIIGDVAERVGALQKFSDTEHIDKNNKRLDFNTLIEETLKQSRPLWKDGMEKEGLKINIQTDFKEIPKIGGNSGELKSAIYNLIKNSIEAMPTGGDLTIKTGVKEKMVYATFTDTGTGMDEETKLKIFQPFFSTKGFESGRGLGMSGVYSIVKKHGGDIIVKNSQLNKGTTLELIFPISELDDTTVANKNETNNKEDLSVLWVDDDFLIAASARIMVESIGHKCTAVNNGKKALEHLNNNNCDIVFTDIGMSNMNGWELADEIRSKFQNEIKIVVVTGWDVKEDLKEKHKINFVLQKPFTMKQLQKIIQDL
jgi:signal transduction histidine kinase/CheY-like chemotaxis protein